MEECDAFCLTEAEEAHHLHIHQRHLVQVQRYPGPVAFYLCPQFLKILRLQVADQPERRMLPISIPFNLFCPLRCLFSVLCDVMTVDGKSNCKNGTIRKLLT